MVLVRKVIARSGDAVMFMVYDDVTGAVSAIDGNTEAKRTCVLNIIPDGQSSRKVDLEANQTRKGIDLTGLSLTLKTERIGGEQGWVEDGFSYGMTTVKASR